MRELYRRDGVPEALKSGSATGIATAMRATGYFEAPVKRYAKGILGNAKSIAASLGEPLGRLSGLYSCKARVVWPRGAA